jgi:protein-disulfide isomerase
MPDSDNTKENKKHPLSALLFSLLIFALLASLFLYQKKKIDSDAPYDEFNLLETLGFESDSPQLDIVKVNTSRIIGDVNAPVKISEYSSFTCGACGLFHREAYERIKKDYIDTGKAYLVFNSIPRNVQDVSISTIAHCLPEKAYFTFLDLIFETQKEWMGDKNPVKQVKEKAVVAGVPSESIDECYNSEELRKTLVVNAKKALSEFNVEQTPTLVINDTHLVMGLDSYEKLRDVIEVELAKTEALTKELDKDQKVIIPNADTTNIKDEGSADDEKLTEGGLNIEELVKPRILGNPEAPLKISDHSSYTCGACASFHLESFDKIKAEYLDTGKAYLIFDDFPRNGTDVAIGAIARCIPDSDYFKFVELIFKSQNTWMRSKDPLNFIKQNAKLTGADPKMIDKCAEDQELHEALAAHGQSVYENLGVNSTPTFIINDKERLVGNVLYSQFKKAIEAELVKIHAHPKGQ